MRLPRRAFGRRRCRVEAPAQAARGHAPIRGREELQRLVEQLLAIMRNGLAGLGWPSHHYGRLAPIGTRHKIDQRKHDT